jgi:uncharacterized protein
MNMAPTILKGSSRRLSDEGRGRLVSRRSEPLFLASWERVLFVHFEVGAVQLQRDVPFPLDLHNGRAYVSLVAFTMRAMRFRHHGKVLSWLLKPVATHGFLNVRTYVRHGGEHGIYFLTEWLSNWLSVQLGPFLYGLPYQFAEINYRHEHEKSRLSGRVKAQSGRNNFNYEAYLVPNMAYLPCLTNSLDEFLVERYTAFTSHGFTRRCFRIWHPPWPQAPVNVLISDDSLLKKTWPWFDGARLVGANYSPGFGEVWMGRPHRIP